MKTKKQNQSTNDMLATDTHATMRDFLILQMRETCKREQDIEEAIKSEKNKEAINYLEAHLAEARLEHRKSTQAFLAFLKGNPPLMRSVTHLNLSK